MKSTTLKSMSLALVAGLALVGLAAPSHADTVTYSTNGIFTGGDAPGTNQYIDAAHGILITFEGVPTSTVDVPPPSQALFGTFDTTGTTATSLQSVNSGFTLTIIQSDPAASSPSIDFTGTLQGQLARANSQAFVQFSAPLVQTIVNDDGSQTVYHLLEADSGTLGRSNLNPPSTGSGQSTVDGSINLTNEVPAVPEPSSILMASLAVPALLLYGRSRKLKATA